MLAARTTLGGYRIERLIGEGGMGVVYEATQLSLDRRVALKVLSSSFSLDTVFRERFRREGVAQATVEHPHIVPIYEAGESAGELFLAMRYVRGKNLKALIRDHALTPSTIIRLLGEIGEALDAAHKAGLIHRDIKPQNILVEDGHAYLADFGLTKIRGEQPLTLSGQQLGTLDYMAPEQIRNEPLSAQSDIYALGAVIFECLSGRVPFPRDSNPAVMFAHLEDPPPSLHSIRREIPSGADVVVARAMAKSPGGRQRTGAQLIAELSEALAPEQPTTPLRREKGAREGRVPVASLWRGGRAIGLLTILVALGVIGAVAGLLLRGGSDPPKIVHETRPTPSASLDVAFAGLRYPATWAHSPGSSSVLPLRLRPAETTTARAGRVRPGLVLGVADSSFPAYLPKSLEAIGRPERVSVGGLRGYLYPRTKMRQGKGTFSTFVFPTDHGTLVAICLHNGRPTTAGRSCSSIVGTLITQGAHSSFEAPRPQYARRLETMMRTLRTMRTSLRGRLRPGASPARVARSARRLASAYAHAETTLKSIHGTPLEDRLDESIIAALEKSRTAYARLARAAEAGNRKPYTSAVRAVGVGEKLVETSLRGLRSVGYRVS